MDAVEFVPKIDGCLCNHSHVPVVERKQRISGPLDEDYLGPRLV